MCVVGRLPVRVSGKINCRTPTRSSTRPSFFFLMCVCVVVSFVPGGVFQDRSERGEGKIRTSLDLIGWFHAVEFEPKNQVNKKQIIHGKLFIIDEHVLKDETEQN